MTVVNPKSISGINSITTGSGGDNLLTIHTSDANNTERVRVNSSGDVIIGSGVTLSPDGDVFVTGVCTATSFVGNGSGLTNLATDLVNDTSPQLGGNLDTNSFEISLDDSHNINFGDGADCTMNHSGADFAITNTTGNLNILNNSDEAVQIRHGSETMIKAISDGAVELYHDGTKQCETSANGLAFPSGKGIDFSATSDAGGAASELLDDYEEGTWTPTFNSSGASWAYNHQYGYYQKVGNTVHVSFYITLGNGTVLTGTTSNSLHIDLPFQVTNSTRYEAAVCFSMVYKFNLYTTGSSDDIPLTGRVYQNDTKIDLLAQLDDAAGYSYTAIKANQAGCGLAGSVTYRVA